VFDEKLGEIFTVRTAGESLDAAGIASIEYAVEHLGPQLIVVMGHTKCGAVKAALGTLDGSDAGSENLNKLVQDLHPRLKSFEGKAPSGDFEREGWANAKGVAQDLGKRSKIIASKLKDGTLQIVPALYHLDSGKVDWAG
jgi:carbonic anhydrase